MLIGCTDVVPTKSTKELRGDASLTRTNPKFRMSDLSGGQIRPVPGFLSVRVCLVVLPKLHVGYK